MDEYKKEMEVYITGMNMNIEGTELDLKYLQCQKENIDMQLKLKQKMLIGQKKQHANAIKRYNEINSD